MTGLPVCTPVNYAVGVYALFDVLLSRVEPSDAPYAPIRPRRIARFAAQATDNLRMLERVTRQDAHTSFPAAIADLIAGRTLLVQCANGASSDWSRVEASFGAAIGGFTVAAMQEYVAYTLLAQAMLKRHRGISSMPASICRRRSGSA